jgi:hypothetical protein
LISFVFGFLVGLLVTGAHYLALRVLSGFPHTRRTPVLLYLCVVGVIIGAGILLVRGAQLQLESLLNIYTDRSWRMFGFAVGIVVAGGVLYAKMRRAGRWLPSFLPLSSLLGLSPVTIHRRGTSARAGAALSSPRSRSAVVCPFLLLSVQLLVLM